jgi:predicted ATPase
MPNPFFYGGRITDPQQFVGRETALKTIFSALGTVARGQAQHISIVGERRIGKSSLLWYVTRIYTRRLKQAEKYRFVYIDLEDPHCHKLSNLLGTILEQLQIKQPSKLTVETFDEAIKKFKKDKDIMPVICLDEFEHLTKHKDEFPDRVYETWRSLGNASKAVFLTASKQSLDALTRQGNLTSPFHNIFRVLELGEFTEVEAHELLGRAKKSGNPFTKKEEDKLLNLAGCHPAKLQIAAGLLYDAKEAGGKVDWEKLKKEFRRQVNHNMNQQASHAHPILKWVAKVLRFIFVTVPNKLGRILLDLMGRDKAAESTATLVGWIVIGIILALVLGWLNLETLKSVWRFFFPEKS